MSAPRDLNNEHTKDLVRINAAKHWGSFYGNAMSMDLDIWLDDKSEEKQDSLAAIFNDDLRPDMLKFLVEHMHYKLKHDDLSDDWLKSSCLGMLLEAKGFRIMAVIERVKSFNFEILQPAMKCSLLIGLKEKMVLREELPPRPPTPVRPYSPVFPPSPDSN